MIVTGSAVTTRATGTLVDIWKKQQLHITVKQGSCFLFDLHTLILHVIAVGH